MKEQFIYFLQDINRILGKRKSRILYVWLSRSFAGLFMYRLERSFFLTFGKYYSVLRIFLLPILNLIQAYSNLDIHYKAAVKGGLLILHPSNGIVISRYSIIGSNLTLTGGNVIGLGKKCNVGDFVIGDNCNLGANAVIMGPLKMANNIRVGASA
jgi:serine acetyltransferase